MGGYIIAPVMRLPESGMVFRMEADLDINPDGTFNELTGVRPDVQLPPCELPDRADKKTLLKDPWIQEIINGLSDPNLSEKTVKSRNNDNDADRNLETN